MKTVILLNPPGKRIYMRDYYCSKISKGRYYNPPVDFIVLSGLLADRFDVKLIDCIAEGLSPQCALRRVYDCLPHIVIFLTGAVSWEEDMCFMRGVKTATGAFIVGIGDIFLDFAWGLMVKEKWLDAVLLDFTTDDVMTLLLGEAQPKRNVVYRLDSGEVVMTPEEHGSGLWSIPRPRHELFISQCYRFPFARHRPFATLMTNFGCPYRCAYCPVSRFPYKQRSLVELQEEFSYLQGLGVKELFFKDQTFGGTVACAHAMSKVMFDSNYAFSWTCFLRPEMADPQTLLAMKEAGCHTIIFGVESADPLLLEPYHRRYDYAELYDVFKRCRDFDIETVATFVLGLPGETPASLRKTIELSQSIMCDYASFNIFTPAYGTALRRQLVDSGVVQDKLVFMDSGISFPTISTQALSAAELWHFRQKAVREFYCRPVYWRNRICRVRSLWQLCDSLGEFGAILGSLRGSYGP